VPTGERAPVLPPLVSSITRENKKAIGHKKTILTNYATQNGKMGNFNADHIGIACSPNTLNRLRLGNVFAAI